MVPYSIKFWIKNMVPSKSVACKFSRQLLLPLDCGYHSDSCWQADYSLNLYTFLINFKLMAFDFFNHNLMTLGSPKNVGQKVNLIYIFLIFAFKLAMIMEKHAGFITLCCCTVNIYMYINSLCCYTKCWVCYFEKFNYLQEKKRKYIFILFKVNQ